MDLQHQWAATLFLHDVPGETGSWPDTTKARNVRRNSPRPYVVPGDPMRIDYSYRHNGTHGFVHTLSVTRARGDFKQLAYTAERIRSKERLKTEFAAVTDVPLVRGNKCDDFVAAALREVSIEPVPMEGFAVWVAKLKPMLQ